MLDHAAGDFPLAHDHHVCAVLYELIEFGVEMGAGDDLQVRMSGSGLQNDLSRLEGFRNGDQKHPCLP